MERKTVKLSKIYLIIKVEFIQRYFKVVHGKESKFVSVGKRHLLTDSTAIESLRLRLGTNVKNAADYINNGFSHPNE